MAHGPQERPKKPWRERLGLVAPAPDPADWVSVLSARITDAETGASRAAAVAAQVLTDAGVETEQRPYTVADTTGFHTLPGAIPSPVDCIRVAVLVRRRDLEHAKDLLRPHVGLPDDPEPEPISDEELTRLSEEAGRPPSSST
jgi:hypothetical protein